MSMSWGWPGGAAPSGRRVQYAALPYRVRRDGEVQVRLITSRETRRWVIPKGWPIKGLTPPKTAAREAYEEAGLVGVVSREPVGLYTYEKRLGTRSVLCDVLVFPLKVKQMLEKWPERFQRYGFWFSIESAAAAVQEEDLALLIRAFGDILARKLDDARRAADEAKAADDKAKPRKAKMHKGKAKPDVPGPEVAKSGAATLDVVEPDPAKSSPMAAEPGGPQPRSAKSKPAKLKAGKRVAAFQPPVADEKVSAKPGKKAKLAAAGAGTGAATDPDEPSRGRVKAGRGKRKTKAATRPEPDAAGAVAPALEEPQPASSLEDAHPEAEHARGGAVIVRKAVVARAVPVKKNVVSGKGGKDGVRKSGAKRLDGKEPAAVGKKVQAAAGSALPKKPSGAKPSGAKGSAGKGSVAKGAAGGAAKDGAKGAPKSRSGGAAKPPRGKAAGARPVIKPGA